MDEDEVVCEVCGTEGIAEVLVLCDGCGGTGARHIFCMEPPKEAVPDGKWYCPFCKNQRRKEMAELARVERKRKIHVESVKEKERKGTVTSTVEAAPRATMANADRKAEVEHDKRQEKRIKSTVEGIRSTKEAVEVESGKKELERKAGGTSTSKPQAQVVPQKNDESKVRAGTKIALAKASRPSPLDTINLPLSSPVKLPPPPPLPPGGLKHLEKARGWKPSTPAAPAEPSSHKEKPDEPFQHTDDEAGFRAKANEVGPSAKALVHSAEEGNFLHMSTLNTEQVKGKINRSCGKIVPMTLEWSRQHPMDDDHILWKGLVVLDGLIYCNNLVAKPADDVATINPLGCQRTAEMLPKALLVALEPQESIVYTETMEKSLYKWATLQILPDPNKGYNPAYKEAYKNMRLKRQAGLLEIPDERREVILWPGINARKEQIFWVLVRPSTTWTKAQNNNWQHKKSSSKAAPISKHKSILAKRSSGLQTVEGVRICLLGFPREEKERHEQILLSSKAKIVSQPEVNKVDIVCVAENAAKNLEMLSSFSARLFLDWKIRFISGVSDLSRWCRYKDSDAFDVSKNEIFARGIIIVFDVLVDLESVGKLAFIVMKLKALSALEERVKGDQDVGSKWVVKVPSKAFSEVSELAYRHQGATSSAEQGIALQVLLEECERQAHIAPIANNETSQSRDANIPQIIRTSIKIASFSQFNTRLVMLMTCDEQTLAAGSRHRSILCGDYGYSLVVLKDCTAHFENKLKLVTSKQKRNKIRFAEGF